jgi:hypothetical protein
MPEQFAKTGYIKKPSPDPRNWILEKQQAPIEHNAIPASFITPIGPWKLPQNIFMQSQEPSCVAHLVTWMLMVKHWQLTGEILKLSPRYLYAKCKLVDGVPAEDGTYLETALNIAKNTGICEDKYFPNDCSLPVSTYADASLISAEADANAATHKIASYLFLSDFSVQGLQNAIAQNGIVGICTDISSHWWTNSKGQNSWFPADLLPLKPNDATHPAVGGHAVALYAYGEPWDGMHPTNFWGMNWWSSAWAYMGRFCCGADYEPMVHEGCTITV